MEVPRKFLLPDGWADYCRHGKRVEKTRFVPCKVPLKENFYKWNKMDVDKQFPPSMLKKKIPNVGLVIDLTHTVRYYDGEEFLKLGVDYKKIYIPGNEVPSTEKYTEFYVAVKTFLNDHKNDGKVIVVHCTHGLNRTGYLICRYMIKELGMPAAEAVKEFNKARGHEMEKYINDLEYFDNLFKLHLRYSRKRPASESI